MRFMFITEASIDYVPEGKREYHSLLTFGMEDTVVALYSAMAHNVIGAFVIVSSLRMFLNALLLKHTLITYVMVFVMMVLQCLCMATPTMLTALMSSLTTFVCMRITLGRPMLALIRRIFF